MISGKQLKILAYPYTRYTALICDGAIRSGKSSIMTWAFVDWAMREFDGQRFALCGKTVDSCAKNIVVPFTSMTLAKQRYQLSWRRQEKVLEVRRGKRVNYFEVFGGKDESSYALIQGRTLAGVLLDEVALQPRSFVEQALGRCSVTGSRFWFNCNPGPPSHWFYKEWIKEADKHNALHLHFLLGDNPSLSPEIVERYKTMYTGLFYRRYILGEWCAAEGLVYPMFDRARNVVEGPYYGGTYYVSVDYGTLNPTAMGLWRVSDGKATMVKEYYYDGRAQRRQKTDEEYCDDLEAFCDGYNIERVIIDPSAASFKEAIRRRGMFDVLDANNSVLDGIRNVGSMLLSGRLTFDKSCVNTFDEFGAYRWDEKSGTDAVIKEQDHAMDMIRYFVQTTNRMEELL